MQGQSNHFTRYAPEKIPYGMSRYQNETRRLYRVMDTTLAKSSSGFLVGDRVTIADIASWGWVASASTYRSLSFAFLLIGCCCCSYLSRTFADAFGVHLQNGLV